MRGRLSEGEQWLEKEAEREKKKLMEVENRKGAGEGKFTSHTYQTRPYNEAKSVFFFPFPLFCSFLGSSPADQSLLSDYYLQHNAAYALNTLPALQSSPLIVCCDALYANYFDCCHLTLCQ